jgi:hypothetical protein
VEEGPVHAQLELRGLAEALPELPDHDPQEAIGILGVVHVARPIAQPQDLAELGHVHAQRVVRGILRAVRAEAPCRPLHVASRAQHAAIEVEGDATKPQPLDLLVRG